MRRAFSAVISRPLLYASVVLVVLLFTAASSSAYLPIRLHLVGKSVSRLYADGSRWAAYEPSSGTTRVIDARTGRAADRSDPGECSGAPNGGSGRLVAVGSGYLLYDCQGVTLRYMQRYVVENILGASQHIVVAELPSPEGDGFSQLDGVGIQWLSGLAYGYRTQTRIFLNWHTGQLVEDHSEPVSAVREVENLNSAGLLQSLCHSIKRIPNFSELSFFQVRFTPFEYASPFAVADEAVMFGDQTAESYNKPLWLMRCGSTQSRRLPGSGVSLQLGSGILTWIALGKEKPVMYATRLNNHGRRWHNAIRRVLGGPKNSAGPGAQSWLLQHTATMIYQSVAPDPSSQHNLIYVARMP
jgi:hypothetical protein